MMHGTTNIKYEVLGRSALFLPKNGNITSPISKAENPVFKSVAEAFYSLLESSEEVYVTGSGTGHIPGHIVGWGLV